MCKNALASLFGGGAAPIKAAEKPAQALATSPAPVAAPVLDTASDGDPAAGRVSLGIGSGKGKTRASVPGLGL